MNDPKSMTDKLTKVYEVKTCSGVSLGLHRAIAYFDFPTFTLEDVSGKQIHWREDLCKEATHEEEVEYWKRRAIEAEKRANCIGMLGYSAIQRAYQGRTLHDAQQKETP